MALLVHAGAAGQVASGANWDGHLIWALPFDNNSAQPGLDWIGASFPDILNQRLSSAGFLTIRREDRRYAWKHLGLPAGFHPTLATTYRLAQTLDADYVILGSYTVAQGRIVATARVLAMHGLRIQAPLQEQGDLAQLLTVENTLAWRVAKQIDPSLQLDKQTFVAASHDLRLDAFENYIRGETEPGSDEQISHLSKAVAISPNYIQAWLALGNAYFASQQYQQAEAAYAKVPRGNRLSLEALFYSGLSYLYTGNYAKAQAKFSTIASVLPMPEVLNDEGVAINRRGQDGTALFQRVVELNPQNADSWFNLAVSLRRRKNYAAALKVVDRCLELHPEDEEAQNLKKNLQELLHAPIPVDADVAATSAAANSAALAAQQAAPAGQPASAAAAAAETPAYEPLERIARSYDESSFRQAAFEMEQMNALKLRSMPPAQQAKLLNQQGTAYVRDGLLLEAERQFQLALAADPKSSAAFAGLAQVHEYVGDPVTARQEANTSLELQPNVASYLVLARLAVGQRDWPGAREYVAKALQLDPKNSAAKGILQAVDMQQGKP